MNASEALNTDTAEARQSGIPKNFLFPTALDPVIDDRLAQIRKRRRDDLAKQLGPIRFSHPNRQI